MYTFKILLISILIMFVYSCVVAPNIESKYDKTCQTYEKKVVLSIDGEWEPTQLECSSKKECKSDFIGKELISIIVFPVSAIISGTIAVVGNTVFWFNELGQCPN